MAISKLELSNVRNIRAANLDLSANLNFVFGQNGAGKSSLLESLYVLGRARSFRSSLAGQVISFDQEALTVAGLIVDQTDLLNKSRIGVKLHRNNREISIRGSSVSSSADLVRAFPVSLVHSGNIGLLSDAPRARRHFLDWGVFHVEPDFLSQWRAYTRALNQRNAILRAGTNGSSNALDAWNYELDQRATTLTAARTKTIEALEPLFVGLARKILDVSELSIKFHAGWNSSSLNLRTVLENDTEADKRLGFTRSGPHKADFSLVVNGKLGKNVFSRGQLKALTIALHVAQSQLLIQVGSSSGCLMIDDLCSELDSTNRKLVLDILEDACGQVIITNSDSSLNNDVKNRAGSVFHVEQGNVTKVL